MLKKQVIKLLLNYNIFISSDGNTSTFIVLKLSAYVGLLGGYGKSYSKPMNQTIIWSERFDIVSNAQFGLAYFINNRISIDGKFVTTSLWYKAKQNFPVPNNDNHYKLRNMQFNIGFGMTFYF